MPSDERAAGRPSRKRKAEPKPAPPAQPPTAPASPASPAEPVEPTAPTAPAGPELARAALEAARAKRGPATRRSPATSEPRRPRGYSGPGPDPRDPQPFGAILDRLMKTRGWQRPAAEAKVFGDWAKVVGEDVASHCHPVKLEDGELTVEAESTAWATQLRLLAAKLLVRIAAEVGHNVVKKLNIHGPVAPSWGRGHRRVRGRGPRDTYG